MLYNYVRFGPIADVAAALRPGISEEPWFQRGLFHPSYSLRHLRVLFLALPVVVPRPPYLLVPWGGVAIWITTPAFVYALRAPRRRGVGGSASLRWPKSSSCSASRSTPGASCGRAGVGWRREARVAGTRRRLRRRARGLRGGHPADQPGLPALRLHGAGVPPGARRSARCPRLLPRRDPLPGTDLRAVPSGAGAAAPPRGGRARRGDGSGTVRAGAGRARRGR